MSRSSFVKTFGIGEIACKAGVAASTIRYYERIGLLPAPERASGKRRYDLSILGKLRVIRLAQEVGFSLAEIQSLLHDFPAETPPANRWEVFAGRKIAELNEWIEEAQMRKSFLESTGECHCASLEDCAAGLLTISAWKTVSFADLMS
jgi:MerR family transcriptional regulator, redox-sensitive transcriptional activator SoxR